jgi:hypothetical protein
MKFSLYAAEIGTEGRKLSGLIAQSRLSVSDCYKEASRNVRDVMSTADVLVL